MEQLKNTSEREVGPRKIKSGNEFPGREVSPQENNKVEI
jgi:hypothetical protein